MRLLLVLGSIILLAFSISAQTDPSRPDFAEFTMDGTRIDSEKLLGKVVVINLWFINCPNCIDEIKLLNTLVDEYKDNKDVVFLGFSASKKADLQKFLIKNPFKYQIVPDAMIVILTKFGTPDKNGDITVPFPMHYILDRDGKVVLKEQGIKGVEKVKSEIKRQLAAKSAAVDGRDLPDISLSSIF